MKLFFRRIVLSLLRFEATMLLSRFSPYIIMVTGSIGKTSTKDAIATALAPFTTLRKSQKSFNSDIGVPLTILGLSNAWGNPFRWAKNIFIGFFRALFSRSYPKVLLLEVGADRPGDIRNLLSWIRPDGCVVTLFPDIPPHVEFYISRDELYAEEALPALNVPREGFVVLNVDDERVRELSKDVHGEVFYSGSTPPALFRVVGEDARFETKAGNAVPIGTEYEFEWTEGEEKKKKHRERIFFPRVLGPQSAYTVSAALAVVSAFDFPVREALSALAKHAPPPGRMNLVEGLKGTTIIDDSYNSSPTALREALRSLKGLSVHGRKIAVLGDMRELGEYSLEAHRTAGKEASKIADILFTVGFFGREIAEGALEAGMDEENIFQFDESPEAGKFLEGLLQRGDVVLVKGSQGMRMERVVEEVMLHPEKKHSLLVRQDSDWTNR